MGIRRIATAATTALVLLTAPACSGSPDKPHPEPPATSSSTPTPTPADPTIAAKAKILSDYKSYAESRARGLLSNDPTYAYDQIMTGKALQAAKSVTTGMHLSGRRFTGSYKYLKGSVVALDLKAKPGTATVEGCANDAIVLRDKSGKALSSPPSKISTKDQLVLVGARWKVVDTATLDAQEGGCS